MAQPLLTGIEMHPEDAKRIKVRAGKGVRASSRGGSITVRAFITNRLRPRVVFIPMHFLENAANRLTNAALDPITKTPEYKACAMHLSRAAWSLATSRGSSLRNREGTRFCRYGGALAAPSPVRRKSDRRPT